MKTFRRIILFIVVLVCGFVVGYCTGQENGKNFILGQYKLLHNDYNTKTELVDAQHDALKAADKVMEANQLFDTDGSDAMVDYLDKASVVDSLNKLEQLALAYCSCLPFFDCGNIKNTSILLGGEERRLLIWGYWEQSPQHHICMFDVFVVILFPLIYSFIAIICINDYYSPLIIYNYVKVSFI